MPFDEPNGHLFYVDDYGQQYSVEWATVGISIDVITTIGQPFVWGQADAGHISNRILYRRGIITVIRQVFKRQNGQLDLLAEGVDQYIDVFAQNFPCRPKERDRFRFHLDSALQLDDPECVVESGPRWVDDDNTSPSYWTDPSEPSNNDDLMFIDVWRSVSVAPVALLTRVLEDGITVRTTEAGDNRIAE